MVRDANQRKQKQLFSNGMSKDGNRSRHDTFTAKDQRQNSIARKGFSKMKVKVKNFVKEKLDQEGRRNHRNSNSSDEDNDEQETQEVNKKIIKGILPGIISKHSYMCQVNETYIWPGTSLEGRIKDHIIILGYIEGIDYFVSEIRKQTDIPIVI